MIFIISYFLFGVIVIEYFCVKFFNIYLNWGKYSSCRLLDCIRLWRALNNSKSSLRLAPKRKICWNAMNDNSHVLMCFIFSSHYYHNLAAAYDRKDPIMFYIQLWLKSYCSKVFVEFNSISIALEITNLIAFLGLFSTNSILNPSNSLFYCDGSQSNDSSNSNVTILP